MLFYFIACNWSLILHSYVEYDWLELWNAVIGLLGFLSGKLDRFVTTGGIERLVQEVRDVQCASMKLTTFRRLSGYSTLHCAKQTYFCPHPVLFMSSSYVGKTITLDFFHSYLSVRGCPFFRSYPEAVAGFTISSNGYICRPSDVTAF